MGVYVGIDLGTTNSTVSVIQTEDTEDSPREALITCPIYQYGRMIGDEITDECLPSALYFDVENHRVYTGRYAKTVYASGDHPLQTALSIKTRMGGDSRLDIPGLQDSSQHEIFGMKECASFFIRTIVNSLKRQFPNIPEITEECVVTVPAAFNADERIATENAVLLGGFKRCIILDEPTAALLSHINSDAEDFGEGYKLVYDIGGGTLDVSIAKLETDDYGEYTAEILGLSERMNLGGDNFDRLLGAYFLKEFEASKPPIEKRSMEDQGRIIARIVSNAEKYKIQMNDNILNAGDDPRRIARASVIATFELIDNMYVDDIVIKKEKMDDLFRKYTAQKATKDSLVAPILTALRNAHLDKKDIGEVILTGGMSNFYAVYETLGEFFGDIPIQMVDDTRTAVSRGAALYHWGLDEDNDSDDTHKLTSISNKMASNIYVRNAQGNFELLISSDMEETEGVYEYTIMDDDVAYFPFYLYSGSEPEANEDNTDTYKQLTGRMIRSKPEYKKGDKIPIEWSLDENKIITISLPEDDDDDYNEDDEEGISFSQRLTPEEIDKSIVQKYTVNG